MSDSYSTPTAAAAAASATARPLPCFRCAKHIDGPEEREVDCGGKIGKIFMPINAKCPGGQGIGGLGNQKCGACKYYHEPCEMVPNVIRPYYFAMVDALDACTVAEIVTPEDRSVIGPLQTAYEQAKAKFHNAVRNSATARNKRKRLEMEMGPSRRQAGSSAGADDRLFERTYKRMQLEALADLCTSARLRSGRSGTFTYQHTLPEDPTELLDESEALLGMLK